MRLKKISRRSPLLGADFAIFFDLKRKPFDGLGGLLIIAKGSLDT
jgi:hypothetical protein